MEKELRIYKAAIDVILNYNNSGEQAAMIAVAELIKAIITKPAHGNKRSSV